MTDSLAGAWDVLLHLLILVKAPDHRKSCANFAAAAFARCPAIHWVERGERRDNKGTEGVKRVQNVIQLVSLAALQYRIQQVYLVGRRRLLSQIVGGKSEPI